MKKPEVGTFFFVTETNRNMGGCVARGDICVVATKEDALEHCRNFHGKYAYWYVSKLTHVPNGENQVYAIVLNRYRDGSKLGIRIGNTQTFRKCCEII